MPEIRDRWAAGATYEDFMGRWSRHVAPRFIAWLRAPANLHWLDVGCGTGALTEAIAEGADPASVTACDPSVPFVEYARTRTHDPRVSFVVAGAGDLPRRSVGYGSVTSSFALNFMPDPVGAVVEMQSLTAPGGMVSACVWDYAGGMQFLRLFWDAATALDPASRTLDEGTRFPICAPSRLEAAFHAAGLVHVKCEALEIGTPFEDFDDYWRPFLAGTGPAPSYVASLDDDRRAALACRIEQALPRQPDGTIALTARAWMVQGRT